MARKLGIYIASMVCPHIVLYSMLKRIFTLGCNGICALFVGLPLMVSSASQHGMMGPFGIRSWHANVSIIGRRIGSQ